MDQIFADFRVPDLHLSEHRAALSEHQTEFSFEAWELNSEHQDDSGLGFVGQTHGHCTDFNKIFGTGTSSSGSPCLGTFARLRLQQQKENRCEGMVVPLPNSRQNRSLTTHKPQHAP